MFTRWVILAALGGLVLGNVVYFAVGRIADGRRASYEASVHPRPIVWLCYEENSYRRSSSYSSGGLAMIIGCGLILVQGGRGLIMPHDFDEKFQLGIVVAIAAASLVPLRNDLHEFARKLTAAPVVAAYEDRLGLSNWRGTIFLPWAEVDNVYTEPPDTGGYVAPEQPVHLHVEAKDGRSWRYSRLDFADTSPALFTELVATAALRTAPPDSMLLRDGL